MPALQLIWLLTLAAGTYLMAVDIACSVHAVAIKELLNPAAVTLYSVAAVLAPELIAAGCLVAVSADQQQAARTHELEQEVKQLTEQLLAERADARRQLEAAEQRSAEPEPEPDLHVIECRNRCGWKSKPAPASSARKAEAGHQRSCPARNKGDANE